MQSKRTPASSMALGGILCALAVILMSLGTIIPIATYTCPALCMVLLNAVRKLCGSRVAWAWYGATAILSLLLAPDKEAAAVFAALGYYPILKPKFEKRKGKWLYKLAFFNGVTLALYWALLYIIGMEQLVAEFSGYGLAMTAVLLILGNATFLLLDVALDKKFVRKR